MKRISILLSVFVLTSSLTACGFCGGGSCGSCGTTSYTTVSCCNTTPW